MSNQATGSTTRCSHAASSIRIAIVDDEEVLVQRLAELFTSWGHEVVTASDATVAVDLLTRFRPQLVLVDLGLPALDGVALAGELRRSVGFEHVCIAALTGTSAEESRKQAHEAGMSVFLVKPVKPEALQALVASVALAVHARAPT